MKIECPNCQKENNLKLEAKVKCGSCGEELTGSTYKKPIISGMALLTIGVIGGQFVDYAVTDNRYPLKTEYSLIESCANSYEKPVKRRIYSNKKEICLCAMEDTMNEISYIRYKVDKDDFLLAFEKNADNCIEQQE